MKKHLIIVLLLITGSLIAQDKYLTKTGTLIFEASVPSFEEVKATNTSVTAILNKDNSEFAALALVKAFRFKNALMEEHFNENYAESDDYPKAIFKGKFNDLPVSGKTTIKGDLTFHGKTKSYDAINIMIKQQGDNIIINGGFSVNVSDFDIKIPKVVSSKLSEKVNVSFEFSLKKK